MFNKKEATSPTLNEFELEKEIKGIIEKSGVDYDCAATVLNSIIIDLNISARKKPVRFK